MATSDELKQAFRELTGVDVDRLELGLAFHAQTPNAPTEAEARRAYNSQCAELYYAIMRQEDIERQRRRQR